MAVTYKHFDDELKHGWGIVRSGANAAHYYIDGYAVCNVSGRQSEYRYTGRLRKTRGLKTDCKNCRRLVDDHKLEGR